MKVSIIYRLCKLQNSLNIVQSLPLVYVLQLIFPCFYLVPKFLSNSLSLNFVKQHNMKKVESTTSTFSIIGMLKCLWMF